MKNTITILLLIFTIATNAQFESGKTVQSKLSAFVSPNSWGDGFSMGIQFNANFDNGIFVSPEVYVFPKLRGTDYFHAGAQIGYNVLHTHQFRVFTGVFLGGVVRHYKYTDSQGEFSEETKTFGASGFIGGIQYTIPGSRFFFGADWFYQYRTDPGNEPNYWRINGFARAGIILN